MTPTRKIPTPKQIGRRLKALREEKDMSRAKLAELAGISREYVRLLEAGRYEPTVTTVLRITRALRVSITEVLR